MQIFDLFDFTGEAYDLKCRPFAPEGAPAGAMVCEVAPGSVSRIHNHAEAEAFLVLEGAGHVTDGTERRPIAAGQGVLFPPFVNHVIENADPDKPLRMISIYWMGDLAADGAAAKAGAPRDTLVFSTPPTPNGDLHLGHLSGPYLAADVLRRALAERGAAALHVTGRDDNQTYVLLKASREGSTPTDVADRFAQAIRGTLAAADIPLDGFIEPDRDGLYAAFVADLVARLSANGFVEARRAPVLVDDAGRVVHEAYVRGSCPHCGEGADGNACEACGRPIACTELRDPIVTLTGAPARVGEAERLFFLMSKLGPRLDVAVKETRMSARAYVCAQSILDDGAPDIPITQPTGWGLPAPVAGFEDQVLYVWFEMAAGYLYGAARALDPQADTVSALWEAAKRAFSGDREIVHCYGFDNTWYHSLLFPAVYAALDMGLVAPRTHVVNELLDLDGSKFSTSRNHLIWGRDLLAEAPADAVRYGLCRARPQGVRANFRLDAFLADANALFAEGLPRWLAALGGLLAPHGGVVPEPGAWLGDYEAYLARIRGFVATCERALSPHGYDAREAADAIATFVADSRRYCEAQAALGLSGAQANYARTAAATGCLGLAAFAILADPIMPDLAGRIRAALGVENDPAAALRFLPSGRAVDPARIAVPGAIAAPRVAAGLAARRAAAAA